eukprot:scaffold7340_cov266-Pinguiococcus_pyrenoidosus.AAC.22
MDTVYVDVSMWYLWRVDNPTKKQNQAKHKSHEAELKEKEHEYDMMHSVADQLNEESVGLLSEQVCPHEAGCPRIAAVLTGSIGIQ